MLCDLVMHGLTTCKLNPFKLIVLFIPISPIIMLQMLQKTGDIEIKVNTGLKWGKTTMKLLHSICLLVGKLFSTGIVSEGLIFTDVVL